MEEFSSIAFAIPPPVAVGLLLRSPQPLPGLLSFTILEVLHWSPSSFFMASFELGGRKENQAQKAWFQVWSDWCQVKVDKKNNFAWSSGYAPSSPVCGLPCNDFWLNHKWWQQPTITLRSFPARLLLSQLLLCTNAGVILPWTQKLAFLLASSHEISVVPVFNFLKVPLD